MSFAYALAPLCAWLAAGATKFGLNSLRARRLAFDQIGTGGMPSSHSAVVASSAALLALRRGLEDPLFGLALTLLIIVVFDAAGLRRAVGRHAIALNSLRSSGPSLRERIGHSGVEILAGLLVGCAVALALHQALP